MLLGRRPEHHARQRPCRSTWRPQPQSRASREKCADASTLHKALTPGAGRFCRRAAPGRSVRFGPAEPGSRRLVLPRPTDARRRNARARRRYARDRVAPSTCGRYRPRPTVRRNAGRPALNRGRSAGNAASAVRALALRSGLAGSRLRRPESAARAEQRTGARRQCHGQPAPERNAQGTPQHGRTAHACGHGAQERQKDQRRTRHDADEESQR